MIYINSTNQNNTQRYVYTIVKKKPSPTKAHRGERMFLDLYNSIFRKIWLWFVLEHECNHVIRTTVYMYTALRVSLFLRYPLFWTNTRRHTCPLYYIGGNRSNYGCITYIPATTRMWTLCPWQALVKSYFTASFLSSDLKTTMMRPGTKSRQG